jgi:hypothetical protein
MDIKPNTRLVLRRLRKAESKCVLIIRASPSIACRVFPGLILLKIFPEFVAESFRIQSFWDIVW